MAHVVEIDEPFDPMAIGLLGSSAIMAGLQRFMETVKKFRISDNLSATA
jgi:hypothetical protein